MNIFQKLNDILVAADCHQLPSVYAGIGSRKTPRDVLDLMTRIAKKLDEWGWTMRSGGADSADTAFENGSARKEIYLPWANFNRRPHAYLNEPTDQAYEIAMKHHPKWFSLSDPAQRLIARNTHEILGAECVAPCSMVVTWTSDGSIGETTVHTGGTGQALRVAKAYEIPIFNLRLDDHRAAWEDVLQ